MLIRAQDIFKNALQTQETRLRVVREVRPPPLPTSSPPPSPDTFHSDHKPMLSSTPSVNTATTFYKTPSVREEPPSPQTPSMSPTSQKMPPAVPARNPATILSTTKTKFAPIANTRIVNSKIDIELVKGN